MYRDCRGIAEVFGPTVRDRSSFLGQCKFLDPSAVLVRPQFYIVKITEQSQVALNYLILTLLRATIEHIIVAA
jgi:predicted RNA-binding protein with PUA-like domain